MALGTTLQYTESNLIGTLYAPITSSATTIQVQFTDKVTGAARTPDATTKLFVVDKGSENAPNPNYEIILVGSHSTTSGITTLTGCTRGLAFTGYSLAAVTANQKAHTAGAVIGCVDVHFMWNTLVSTLKGTGDSIVVTTFATEAALASDVPSPTNGQVVYVTALNSFLFRNNSKWWGTPILVFADATARDASITSPSNGMQVYLTTEGKYTDYTAGAWADRASGTTPNMSTTVAGKGEEATAAEIIANTQTGGTGADLIVNPKYLSDASVTTSAGVGDAGKYVRANSSGYVDGTLLAGTTITTDQILYSGTAGETLTTDQLVYLKQSDGKLYKATQDISGDANAWNVRGIIVTGGVLNGTVTYRPLLGTLTLGTPLTANTEYYLGTGGALTATRPSMISSTVIPYKIGVTDNSGKLVCAPQRLQRRVLATVTLPTYGNTATVTIGFDCSHIIGTCALRDITNGQNRTQTTGYYDVIAGTQANNGEGPTAFLSALVTGGGAYATIAASINGSKNLVLTASSTPAGNSMNTGGYTQSVATIQAYEAL